MPKRGCDVKANEVAKCFKLVAKGICEPISFTVPRKVSRHVYLQQVKKNVVWRVFYSPSFITIELNSFKSELISLRSSLVAHQASVYLWFP